MRNLNRRIIIQRRVDETDEAGQPVDDWEDVTTIWADIKGQTGMGAIKDMQGDVAATISRYSFRIRFRDDVKEGMRALFGDSVFMVKRIQQDFERRRWTYLICETTDG